MGERPTRSRHCKRLALRTVRRAGASRTVTGRFVWEDRERASIRESGNLAFGGVLHVTQVEPSPAVTPARETLAGASMPLGSDLPDPAGQPVRPVAAISWSGGKDSFAALERTHVTHDVVAMVTMFDEEAGRSRSHGLRPELIAAQAERLALEPSVGRCTWQTYDRAFSQTLDRLATRGVTHVVFGDILFEEHRRWAERMCDDSGLIAVEPLWGCSTEALFAEWVSSGAEALIVTARAEFLDETWLGRRLERSMAEEFARLGVDPCGERGEYHTVVTDGHLFSAPVRVRPNGRVQRSGCWALDLVLADAPGGVLTGPHAASTGDPTRAAGV